LSYVRKNLQTLFTQLSLTNPTSLTTPYNALTLRNTTFHPCDIYLSGPNSKVLLNDQSIRNIPTETLTNHHLNFSFSGNEFASNLGLSDFMHQPLTPYLYSSTANIGFIDKPLALNSLTTSSYSEIPHPPLLTINPAAYNPLSYDTTWSKSLSKSYGKVGTLQVETSTLRHSTVGEVFIGSREKTPKSVNSTY
jgi:hypothetical protein